MKLKIIYRLSLKMSPGKLAAQSVHAAIGLGITNPMITVVVLRASDKKYKTVLANLISKEISHYRVFDAGYTEVSPNTETCLAYLGK